MVELLNNEMMYRENILEVDINNETPMFARQQISLYYSIV